MNVPTKLFRKFWKWVKAHFQPKSNVYDIRNFQRKQKFDVKDHIYDPRQFRRPRE